MKIKVGEQEFRLSDTDVKLARAAVTQFIRVAKIGSEKSDSTALYLTTILMMYKMSLGIINEMGPDTVARILNEVNGQK